MITDKKHKEKTKRTKDTHNPEPSSLAAGGLSDQNMKKNGKTGEKIRFVLFMFTMCIILLVSYSLVRYLMGDRFMVMSVVMTLTFWAIGAYTIIRIGQEVMKRNSHAQEN